MNLEIHRFTSTPEATLGLLYIDGLFECFTLEDPFHEVKIHGETRIPAGRYEVELRRTGGMHQRFLERFPDFHRGMLHLRDVPDYQYVQFHPGNTPSDTEGCPLLGDIADLTTMTVKASTPAYKRMYLRVLEAMDRGEPVEAYFYDEDI